MKGVTLTWEGLAARAGEKVLLQSCEGYCKPGEMLAIMGPSGAGKTTMLSLLAQKADGKLGVEGAVRANGQTFSASQFYNFGVYVYQNDILHEMLTVRETLQFAADLRFKDANVAQRKVGQLIRDFELQKCEQAYVGGQIKKGISGGEKKRLCIAIEMVSQPSLLVLDEPTSGLDSHKAAGVLRVLRRLCGSGCTIIFTIHQPSYLLYSQLTRLVLLDRGVMIYQGDAQKVEDYMRMLEVPIPPLTTISDCFMMEISEYKAQKQKDYKSPINHDNYQLHLGSAVRQELGRLKQTTAGWQKLQVTASFLFMWLQLFWRERVVYVRNPMKLVGALLNAIVGIIMIGVFFVDEIPSESDLLAEGQIATTFAVSQMFLGVQGVSFINITSMIMTGIFAVQLAFPTDREIYYKQASAKKYWPLAYFLAKVLMELLNIILCALLFGCAVYWINGFDPDFTKFCKYLLTLALMSMAGNSFGFFIGALFKDAKKSSELGPLFLLPLMAFSGMYNKLNDIPDWMSWLQYISPFRYGLHLVLTNQYGSLEIPTLDGSYKFREDLDMRFQFWENVMIVVGVALGFYTLTFILLKKLSSQLSV